MKLILILACLPAFAQQFDLLLKGGHVIDPKNKISAVMDVAIASGKIARVAANIPAAEAKTVANVAGLYVTPGLIDIHAHVYTGTGTPALAGDHSVYPDTFSFRSGCTTVVDAGTSGWRNFEDFRTRVIVRARTRVLAFLNIYGKGMGPGTENDVSELNPVPAANMAKQHPDIIVGFKSAHFGGEGWESIDAAVKAGNTAKLPVMVDFGTLKGPRNLRDLLADKLRPGDIYTHVYSGLRDELLPTGKMNPALDAGRKRGIYFDVGHGAGSFFWNVADQAAKEKFMPDSISTDLHIRSLNGGMKDMTNVMSKILNMGASIDDVVAMSTWNPAREIKRPTLGNLDVGAEADVTVLRVDTGKFGFVDSAGARNGGDKLVVAEMTVRAGAVVWDLNGLAAPDWHGFQYRRRTP